MKDLLSDALARSVDYLNGLSHRPVEPRPDAIAKLEAFSGALPDAPTAPKEVLRRLDEWGSPATIANAGPRYFGFVTGGALPASLAANWLAGAWDQNAHFVIGSPIAAALEDTALAWVREILDLPESWGGGFVTGTTMGNFSGLAAGRHAVLEKAGWDVEAQGLFIGSPIAAALEDTALAWVREILDLPESWGGGFVTGTTMGNFSGLAAGRHAVLEKAGWDVEAQGLFDAPEVQVIVGAEAHTTLLQALALVGFGRERVTIVPVDEQGRMRADRLPKLRAPSIVCLQAGNVNTGSFDPVAEIAAPAREAGAWIHLDGAFGLWAAASPKTRHLTEGIAEVDSIATDLHKWLNVPYDNGLALYRDPEAARQALSITAAYLPKGEERQPCDYTPESSRRARGVEIWAALLSLGRSGLRELIERHCRFARHFADGLRAAGHEILNDVVLNQVLVSFGSDEKTARVITAVQEEGTCWCSGTTWRGRGAMRISVSSWATTEEDVEQSLAAIVLVAKVI